MWNETGTGFMSRVSEPEYCPLCRRGGAALAWAARPRPACARRPARFRGSRRVAPGPVTAGSAPCPRLVYGRRVPSRAGLRAAGADEAAAQADPGEPDDCPRVGSLDHLAPPDVHGD